MTLSMVEMSQELIPQLEAFEQWISPVLQPLSERIEGTSPTPRASGFGEMPRQRGSKTLALDLEKETKS